MQKKYGPSQNNTFPIKLEQENPDIHEIPKLLHKNKKNKIIIITNEQARNNDAIEQKFFFNKISATKINTFLLILAHFDRKPGRKLC